MNADQSNKKSQIATNPDAAVMTPAEAQPHQSHQGPLIDPENALVRGFKSIYAKIKSGNIGSPKILAGVLLIFLVGLGWWWFSSQSATAESSRWKTFDRASSSTDFERIATENKDTAIARYARLEKARLLMGPEGIIKLQTERKKAERLKAVGNIETARTELIKLADEFKKDPTLRVQCLSDASEAELVLVGWPREGQSNDPTDDPNHFRGKVDRVVELLKQAAEAVGPKTTAGEKLVERANQYSEKATEILTVQRSLYAHMNQSWEPEDRPKMPFDPKSPFDPKMPITPPLVPPTIPTPPPSIVPEAPKPLTPSPTPVPTPTPAPTPTPGPAPTPKTPPTGK